MANQTTPTVPPPDVAQITQSLRAFMGRVKTSNDPKVKNAVTQLQRDLKRAKINLDNS